MTPLRISADPPSLVKWLLRILILVAVGLFFKLLLVG
jgi:hypothetical protein